MPKRKTEYKLLNLTLGSDFLDLIPKVKAIQAKINGTISNKHTKTFCTAKETINKVKRHPTK